LENPQEVIILDVRKLLHKIPQILVSKETLVITLILLVGAILRFYNLPEGMHYLGDEGRDALIAKAIIKFEHFPLVGPPTSIGNLYLGPLYFYLMAPFIGLFGFEPMGAAVFVILLSLATIGLIYFLAKEMLKSQLAAGLSALLYAVSPAAVEYGRWPWNPNVMPFFAILFIFSLWQVLEKRKERWIILTGVSLALILQSHYMGLAAIPVLIVALLIKKPKLKNRIYWLIGLGSFLFLMSPLLAFDLRHDFLNARGFWEIVTERSQGGFSLLDPLSRARDRVRQVFGDFSGFGERSLVNNLVLIVGIVSWIVLETKKRRWWLLGAWLIAGGLFIGLYQGPTYFHYLEFLLPVCALSLGAILALLLQRKRTKYLGLILTTALVGVFLFQSKSIVARVKVPNVEVTKELVRFIYQKAGERPFNFSLLAESNYDSAYRYFFELWKIPAEYGGEVTGQLFVICEGEKICQPQGNPKWEIAVFDAAYDGKIEQVNQWEFYNFIRVFHFKPQEERK